MVDNLEKSREELAKRQREIAWREMAKQVAHEIKNPLTPIKLTLQQMENSMQQGSISSEKSIKSIKSVLHQVDILNEIASSFSAFAQMPELKLEPLNIMDVLGESVSLFSNSMDGQVTLSHKGDSFLVMADRKLFSRIFSNIILNAFQSRRDGKEMRLEINVMSTANSCIILFSDNGQGIDSELLGKIFIPYFSTKETGSGLGLAIAKQGIEQAGGKIWCESILNTGTKFYISLPLLS
jgi:nitrogen fixation/metabolism regulation signal transduction histidine kinase